MGELINGRTPEEIKTALKVCPEDMNDCPLCPYTLSFTCRDSVMSDAIALIERLESERDAALAKVPKWISVKSKLPPRELKILAVDGHGCIRMLAFWKKEKDRWTWIENLRFTHRNDITHWMPLPEPPKEENT